LVVRRGSCVGSVRRFDVDLRFAATTGDDDAEAGGFARVEIFGELVNGAAALTLDGKHRRKGEKPSLSIVVRALWRKRAPLTCPT
jgi:hypothetical protein